MVHLSCHLSMDRDAIERLHAHFQLKNRRLLSDQANVIIKMLKKTDNYQDLH